MAIIVANLLAQVGADTTRFKQGMAEVDARLEQVASKAVTVSNRVDALRRKAAEAAVEAARLDVVSATAAAAGKAGAASAAARAADRQRAREGDLTTTADDLARDAAANEKVAQASIARIAETAREHQVRVLNSISSGAATAGTVVVGALAAATTSGARFNNMLLTAAHNTSLTTDQVVGMRKAVRDMGMESGASFSELAGGFQRIENYGYSAADAVKIETQAMRSAVSAGSDMMETSSVLAMVMRQYGISVDDANKAMNVLHVTSQLSSIEMEQLVHIGGQVYGMASNLGVGFVDASAAIVTFTKGGLDASTAMTNFRNDLQKLEHPTDKVLKQMKEIKKHTGVDLTKTFNYTAIKEKGLEGAFADIRKAAEKGGYNPQALADSLFPNLRGTIGAMILSSNSGYNTFLQAKSQLQGAMRGEVDPTNVQYNETLKETETQVNRVRNAMQMLTADISRAMAPVVLDLAERVGELVDGFSSLSDSEKESRIVNLAWIGTMLILAGGLGKFAVSVIGVVQTLKALTGAATATQAFGMLGTAIKGNIVSIGIWSAAVVAAVAILYNLNKAIYEQQTAETRAIEASKEAASAHAREAAASADNARRAKELVAEYNNLEKAAKPTNEQMDRKRQIMHELLKLSPDLVTGYQDEAGKLSLVADAAQKAADKYDILAKAKGRAAAMEIRTNFFANIDRHGQVQRLAEIARSGDAEKYREFYNSHLTGPFGWGGLDDQGKALQEFGLEDPKRVSGQTTWRFDASGNARKDTPLDPEWVKRVLANAAYENQKFLAEKRLMNEQAGMASGAIKAPVVPQKNIPDGGGAPPPPSKENKKRAKDPLQEWRDYILGAEERLYKFEHDGPTADADWLKVKSRMEERVKGVKTIEEAYRLAKVAAQALDVAEGRRDAERAADRAIRGVDRGYDSIDPSNLSQLARWQVGDPSKDVWKVSKVWDPLAGVTRDLSTQVRATGGDPEMSKWLPGKKEAYIAAMDAKQLAAESKKAGDQWRQMQKTINAPLEPERTPGQDLVERLKLMPELWAQLQALQAMGAPIIDSLEREANETSQRAEDSKKFWDYFKSRTLRPVDALIAQGQANVEARLTRERIKSQAVFGQEPTEEMRARAASVDVFRQSYDDLTPELQAVAVALGRQNKELEDAQALWNAMDSAARLAAQSQAALMQGTDFDRWLMRTHGLKRSQFDTQEKIGGLTLEQYRAAYQQSGEFGTESDQASKMERMRAELERSTTAVKMMRNSSKEAQLAWEFFGMSIDRLTPQMRAQLERLVPEFEKLDAIRRVERKWRMAADTMEGVFTNTFQAVLSEHANFWDTFTKEFERAIIGIIASEGAKELVRWGKKLLHPDKKGDGKDGKDGKSGEDAASVVPDILSSVSDVNPLPVKIIGSVDAGVSDIAKQFAPGGYQIPGMPGVPGIPGMGGLGGGLGDRVVQWGASQLFGAAAGPWAQGLMFLDKLTGNHVGGFLDDVFGGLFDKGGRAVKGKTSVVNDGGSGDQSELLVPTSDMNVIPADMTQRIRAVMASSYRQPATAGPTNVTMVERYDYSGGVVIHDKADAARLQQIKDDRSRTKLRMITGR